METASSVFSPHLCLPHFQVSSSPNPFPPLTLIPLHTANTFTHSLSCILVLNIEYTPTQEGFRGGLAGKESACQHRTCGFNPWVRKITWRRKWQPTPLFLTGKFHGQRSLAGYNPCGHKELDTTEHTFQTKNHAPALPLVCYLSASRYS